MRKILLLVLCAVVSLASCQKNDFDPDGGGQMVNMKISAALPTQSLGTRVDSEPTISDDSETELEKLKGYKLRYTLQLYFTDAAGESMPIGGQLVQDKPDFDVKLVANTKYRAVIWADFVPETGYDEQSKGYHYDTSDLKNIKIKDDDDDDDGRHYQINDPTRDAYFYSGEIIVDETSAEGLDCKLSRPFAQINIKTEDLSSLLDTGKSIEKVEIEYASIPSGFNALKGETVKDAYLTNRKPKGSAPAVAPHGTNELDEGWLAYDFIFANAAVAHQIHSLLIDFVLKIDNGDGDGEGAWSAKNVNCANIPLNQNYRTNISLVEKEAEAVSAKIDAPKSTTVAGWSPALKGVINQMI